MVLNMNNMDLFPYCKKMHIIHRLVLTIQSKKNMSRKAYIWKSNAGLRYQLKMRQAIYVNLLCYLNYVQTLKVQIKQVSESCFLITINLFTI